MEQDCSSASSWQDGAGDGAGEDGLSPRMRGRGRAAGCDEHSEAPTAREPAPAPRRSLPSAGMRPTEGKVFGQGSAFILLMVAFRPLLLQGPR